VIARKVGTQLRLEICGDGIDTAGDEGAMAGSAERVSAMGGHFSIRRTAHAGTVVSVSLPCG
jgi:signal transduction histidine kinase